MFSMLEHNKSKDVISWNIIFSSKYFLLCKGNWLLTVIYLIWHNFFFPSLLTIRPSPSVSEKETKREIHKFSNDKHELLIDYGVYLLFIGIAKQYWLELWKRWWQLSPIWKHKVPILEFKYNCRFEFWYHLKQNHLRVHSESQLRLLGVSNLFLPYI